MPHRCAMRKMQPIVTDVPWSVRLSVCLSVCMSVCLSVCLLVTTVSCAKTAKPSELGWVHGITY